MQYQLRGELEQSEQKHQGKSFLVVKDPVTRRYFRFTESQALILKLLATPIDVTTLAARASEQLGSEIRVATMHAFLDSLEAKFLIDTPAVREKLGTSGSKDKPGKSILYWQIASINPERIFDWLEPRTKWAFTAGFQVVGILLILSGLTISYIHWQKLWAAAPNLLDFWTVLMVWPIVFAVSAYHEFSHGLTCRHFGGKVNEVGFMLIYFSPAFYCDVSDAWMFPSRRHRMLVTMAGGYSQLMLWGLCAIIWRLTDSDAAINQIMLIVVLFSGLQTLVNFNPLIKLDGYYMLSDYLEVPNLRTKALATLWKWVSGKAGNGVFREQRPQMIYGIASLVFSTTLLVYVYTALFTWVTENWAFAGLVAFAMFSTVTLRKTAAESMTGLKAVATRASLRKWRNLVIVLALGFGSYVTPWELKIPANATILPFGEGFARPEAGGVIEKVLVVEGSRVKKGDVLATLHNFDRLADTSEIESYVATREAFLVRLQAGTRPEEIDKAQKLVDRKNLELKNAQGTQAELPRLQAGLDLLQTELKTEQQYLDRIRLSAKGGLSAQIDLDQAENRVLVRLKQIDEKQAEIHVFNQNKQREISVKEKELEEALSALKLTSAGSNPAEIKQTQDEIQAQQLRLRLMRNEIAKTTIVALIDGIVTTPFPERMINQKLEAGQDFIRIVDTSRVSIEMQVPEKEIADVHSGARVRAKIAGFGQEDFEGRVDFIPLAVQTIDGERVIAVRAELANKNELLKAGMTGHAKIYAGERRVIEIAMRRVKRWINVDLWHLLPF